MPKSESSDSSGSDDGGYGLFIRNLLNVILSTKNKKNPKVARIRHKRPTQNEFPIENRTLSKTERHHDKHRYCPDWTRPCTHNLDTSEEVFQHKDHFYSRPRYCCGVPVHYALTKYDPTGRRVRWPPSRVAWLSLAIQCKRNQNRLYFTSIFTETNARKLRRMNLFRIP